MNGASRSLKEKVRSPKEKVRSPKEKAYVTEELRVMPIMGRHEIDR